MLLVGAHAMLHGPLKLAEAPFTKLELVQGTRSLSIKQFDACGETTARASDGWGMQWEEWPGENKEDLRT